MSAEPERDPALQLARAVAARSSGRPAPRRRPTRRQFAVRRLVVAMLLLGVLSGAVYTLSSLGSPRPHGVAVVAGRTRSTITTLPLPPPPAEPGGGATLFPSHRVVAFYGAPGRPKLGVLGDDSPERLWPRLNEAAAQFASPQTVVVPAYELIAFIADAAPGPDGTYSEEIPAAQIDSYLQVVHAHGGMLILDIQPGRGDLLADAQALEPWLADPDVGLALDPEWELQPTQRPNSQVGRTTATEINRVSAWLQQMVVAHRLPQKLLMVHQFLASMVQDKAAVASYPDLAIAFNMDGFGDTANKLAVYQLLATDTRWTLGYKLFYRRDKPLQTPAQVLALLPAPWIVEYE